MGIEEKVKCLVESVKALWYCGSVTRSYEQFCAVAQALDHVGDRWTLLIVRELLLGPRRFTDLQAALPGIATNLLSARLRSLEADEILRRRQLPAPAGSWVYGLTEAGEALRPVVMELIRWGGRWMAPRRPGLAFRAEWLALALAALVRPARLPIASTDWEIEAEGQTARIRIGSGTVRVVPEPDLRPALVVAGDAGAILGMAAGFSSLDDEIAAGRIELDGPDEAQTTFREVFGAAMAVDAGSSDHLG